MTIDDHETTGLPSILETLLDHVLETLPFKAPPPSAEQLIHYIRLLIKWNRVHNLTAILSPKEMLIRHVFDSLAVGASLSRLTRTKTSAPLPSPLDQEKKPDCSSSSTWSKIIDVGSGCGAPGIMLAVLFPDTPVVLVEPAAKKAAFLRQCKSEMVLKNTCIVEEKIQKCEKIFSSSANFVNTSVIVSRAFSSIPKYLEALDLIACTNTLVAAMKGKIHQSELKEIPAFWKLTGIEKLTVPHLNESRHLVHFRRIETHMDS